MKAYLRMGVVFVLCLSAALAWAGDWPQWRGPHRNGISQEKGLLQKWPEGGPKLLWQVEDVGFGYSTPAVADDTLYLMSNRGLEDEFVQARSAKNGNELWSKQIGKVGNPKQNPSYPGARSTPTVDGDALYVLGSDGDLARLERESGRVVWHKNIRQDFGGEPGVWAYSESPLVDGDALVCTPGGKDATLVAVQKATGDLIWKCAVPGGDQAAYSSVIIGEVAGVKQYIQFLQKGVVGVDARTGKFLWRYDQTAKGSPANIPTPIFHDGYVYSSSNRGGGALIKIVPGENQGDFKVEEVWSGAKYPKAIGGAVLVDGHLYGTGEGGLMCVEFKTGMLKWQSRSIGAASITYADGRLYLLGENGEVALADASPENYVEEGRFTPPNQPERGNSKAWEYPVIANGRLYVRDLNRLWCYDVMK
ncbi:MAG TPA: PQQ-binding-like beta-propeller repeat protein [Planctomycetaceae bacterium]|nr:PQQ-binding-like beta-propeller repeat protein [Planctomycetaceae bacterium]